MLEFDGKSVKLNSDDVIFATSSITAAIVLAEPFLTLRGFKRSEQQDAQPAILRGSLVLRIHKPTKIKSINLEFKGTCRTEWPEGIPPMKIDTHETKTVFHHGWPFFNANNPVSSIGLPMVNEIDAQGEQAVRGRSRAKTLEVKDFFGSLGRNASPVPSSLRSRSSQGDAAKGYKTFLPAEYVYNFELAFPAMLPESTRCNFGYVRYMLEAHVDRQGTFKSNLVGNRELTVLRSLGPASLEYSEPIVLNRNWEDLLRYEIVVAGKAFPLGGKIPIAFSLLPFDKIGLHRIRIFITEYSEYFCKNRKVHRVEPHRRFLLLDKQPPNGMTGSLLDDALHDGSTGATEFELNPVIKTRFPNRRDTLRPNYNSQSIKVHHWIKISMRLSRPHQTEPGARKSYEVSIDSPLMLVDPRTLGTSQLPAYADAAISAPSNTENESLAFQAHHALTEHNRAADFLHQPADVPPSFDADQNPPAVFPPNYDSIHESLQSYRNRYDEYVHRQNDSALLGGQHVSEIYWEEDDDDVGEQVMHQVTHVGSDDEDEHATHTISDQHSTETENLSAETERLSLERSRADDDSESSTPASSTASVVCVEPHKENANQHDDPLDQPEHVVEPQRPVRPVTPEPASVPSSSAALSPKNMSLSPDHTGVTSQSVSAGTPAMPRDFLKTMPKLSRMGSEVDPFDRSHPINPRDSNRGLNESPRPFTLAHMRAQQHSRGSISNLGSRNSSVSSVRSRYYRQTSVVSVDITDNSLQRCRSQVGSQTEVPQWIANHENSSDVNVHISECGADRIPLLNDESELDLVDFDDDAVSLRSRCPSIVTP